MAYRFTILEKVNLFRIILSPLNDYNPRLKEALPFLQKLYLSVLPNHLSCPETAASLAELEKLIVDIQYKINKQENFEAVMQQVHFSNC
ncbi:MAG: hypothetical protein JWQ25_2860 [Daejeonella sp.]|nr:hypothetical protein [Daejeonella sp.]